jgi:hypothetical protein
MHKIIKESTIRRIIRRMLLEVDQGGISTNFDTVGQYSSSYDDKIGEEKAEKIKKAVEKNKVNAIRIAKFSRSSDKKNVYCLEVKGEFQINKNASEKKLLVPICYEDEDSISADFKSLKAAIVIPNFDPVFNYEIRNADIKELIYPIGLIKSFIVKVDDAENESNVKINNVNTSIKNNLNEILNKCLEKYGKDKTEDSDNSQMSRQNKDFVKDGGTIKKGIEIRIQQGKSPPFVYSDKHGPMLKFYLDGNYKNIKFDKDIKKDMPDLAAFIQKYKKFGDHAGLKEEIIKKKAELGDSYSKMISGIK